MLLFLTNVKTINSPIGYHVSFAFSILERYLILQVPAAAIGAFSTSPPPRNGILVQMFKISKNLLGFLGILLL